MIIRCLNQVLRNYGFREGSICFVQGSMLDNTEADAITKIYPWLSAISNMPQCEQCFEFIDALLFNNEESTFFLDRYRLFQSHNYHVFDLFLDYVRYIVCNEFCFDMKTVMKHMKREYVKRFFTENSIIRVELSSLNGVNGLFYTAFSKDITINVTNSFADAFELTLVIQESTELFSYKFSVGDLLYLLFYKTVMSKSWRSAALKNEENALISECVFREIKLLDSGETSVFFIDENQQYIGTKHLTDYAAFFPASVPIRHCFIESGHSREMIEEANFRLLDYYNESIPYISDGRIEGYIKKRDESRFLVSMRFDLITDDTLSSMLKSYTNILFSSDEKGLSELRHRLEKFKNCTVLDEKNYSKFLCGEFDLIISNCMIWNNTPIPVVYLKQLYINAYCIQLLSFLKDNGVSYRYYCIPDSERITNHSKRVSNQSKQYVNNVVRDGGIYTVADGEIEGCIYYHGRRRTTDVPMLWDRTIHFFGPCISIGVFAKDSDTIESFLQRKLNQHAMPFRVVNNPAPLLLNPYDSAINTLHRIGQAKFRSGDIVLHFGRNNLEWGGLVKEDFPREDLSDVFNLKKNVGLNCFIGHMAAHVDSAGYQAIADYISNDISQYAQIEPQKSEYFQFQQESVDEMEPQLQKYVLLLRANKFDVSPSQVIGSVAVNANPFTLGHAYLIDEALKIADYLYVFVAEEDLSDFSFDVRFSLVNEYCRRYNNVKVIPSGKFFASTYSFGDYFNRDALPNAKIDASTDCYVFSKIIAKELNISFRMLGEELVDEVTNQYNEYVKEILSQNNIEVIVIPRLRIDGEIVSAKNVRVHVRRREYEKLVREVPEVTYRFILDHMCEAR